MTEDIKYQHLFDTYIEHRKEHSINESHLDESYKWKLITDCQGLGVMSIAERVRKGNENLMYGYAKASLKWVIENHPQEFEMILTDLSKEGDVHERLNNYNKQMIEILKDYTGRKSLKDERSAAVFLTCINPQKYTFYIYSLYRDFAHYLGRDVKQTLECYPDYLSLLMPLVNIVKVRKGEIYKVTIPIKDFVQSDLLLAQDIIWDYFVKNKQDDIVPENFCDSIIKRINEDAFLVVPKQPTKKSNFIWVGTPDGKIGNNECHYEICWDNYSKRQTHHDGRTVFVEVHFEKDCIASQFYSTLFDGDDRIKKFEWSTKAKALRINDNGYKFADYSEEELVDNVVKELYNLDNIVRPEIEKIKGMEKELEATEPYKKLLESNYNLILTGAPGTGKTYLARQIAAAMIQCNPSALDKSGHFGFVQFHPSYDYTDFVEGLRPIKSEGSNSIGFERKDGVFKEFCKKALSSDDKMPYIFVIDEINRGEISKIFGELFFSIDPGYRGKEGAVRTQYANLQKTSNAFDSALNSDTFGHFFVPENVYIIGTMNDIDRSVESMDFAMRRRFAWKEIRTQDTMDSILDNVLKNDPDISVNDIKEHMTRLNDKISTIPGLGIEYQVGAAYFLKYSKYMNYEDLWNFHLKGLLYEYLRGNRDPKDDLQSLKNAYDGVSEEIDEQ